jgi:hypothetical protein
VDVLGALDIEQNINPYVSVTFARVPTHLDPNIQAILDAVLTVVGKPAITQSASKLAALSNITTLANDLLNAKGTEIILQKNLQYEIVRGNSNGDRPRLATGKWRFVATPKSMNAQRETHLADDGLVYVDDCSSRSILPAVAISVDRNYKQVLNCLARRSRDWASSLGNEESPQRIVEQADEFALSLRVESMCWSILNNANRDDIQTLMGFVRGHAVAKGSVPTKGPQLASADIARIRRVLKRLTEDGTAWLAQGGNSALHFKSLCANAGPVKRSDYDGALIALRSGFGGLDDVISWWDVMGHAWILERSHTHVRLLPAECTGTP